MRLHRPRSRRPLLTTLSLAALALTGLASAVAVMVLLSETIKGVGNKGEVPPPLHLLLHHLLLLLLLLCVNPNPNPNSKP
jgi:hypothetical protein